MNKIILMGRLTADPELRQTQSGISSIRFCVAVNRKFADKQTGERQADFINCVAWRQTAEFISKYFSKGSMIALEGSLRTGSYQDKNYSNVTHYTTDVYVDNVEFAGSKNDGSQAQQGGSTYQGTSYQAEPQTANISNPAIPQNNDSMSYGNLSEFETILSDGDVPF